MSSNRLGQTLTFMGQRLTLAGAVLLTICLAPVMPVFRELMGAN